MTILFLMRAIDPPALNTPVPNGKLLLARGFFDTIVSKNSGGGATYPKISVARELEILVVMVQRPQIPDVEQVADVEGAISWLVEQL
ncbi:precorrin-6A/cobalt-precorrin-6A reductase [Microcoleus sp. N9_A1]|uniref:precorrin-6A/cobalt-precorrin-6A reductase n=1 Tax=Microcoleus sp. N9_A1 TaxID=3055380 RepID=UPI002FD750AD